MKRVFALVLAAAVLVGTAAYLINSQRFSSALHDQLSDDKSPSASATSGIFASGAGVGAGAAAGNASGATGTAGSLASVKTDEYVDPMPPGVEEGEENLDPDAYKKAPRLSEKEKKSLQTVLGLLFAPSRGKIALNNFIQALDAAGLEPVVAKDENPYTGKMLTIRTNRSLPGTRYLHGQWFQDESSNKEPFRQHFSFEVRPSPDCMSVAKTMIEQLLGKKLGTPKQSSDSWAEWDLDDGQVVWVKRLLEKEDLQNNPYNAHTMKDRGTCWVSNEMKPDEHDDEHRKAGGVH